MFGQLSQFAHLLRIVRVLAHHNLDEYLATIAPLKPYLFLLHIFPRRKDDAPRGQRLGKHYRNWALCLSSWANDVNQA